MKVLVIPEDPKRDQHILRPLVRQMFWDLGKRAYVDVLDNPRLRGVDQALDANTVARIVDTRPMIDLFLILVDRDGVEDREQKLQARVREFATRLLGCLAIEEIEVWMLAIHRDLLQAAWREIRGQIHPRELYAEPFLRAHAPTADPARGRAWAMRDLGKAWRGVLSVCPELSELRDRIAEWLTLREIDGGGGGAK